MLLESTATLPTKLEVRRKRLTSLKNKIDRLINPLATLSLK